MGEPVRSNDDRKTVIFVAPYFLPSAPMSYASCLALPHLVKRGWRVIVVGEEVVAPEAEEVVKIKRMWRRPLLRRIAMQREVSGLRRRWPQAVVVGLPGFPLDGDLTAFHFSQSLWLRKQWELGISSFRAGLHFAGHAWLWCWENLHLSMHKGRFLAPVSESMAEHLRQRAPAANVEVLPNCYDASRFNHEAKKKYRAAARRKLGFSTSDYVFIFVSQGHYERKGFWLAVEALESLRNEKNSFSWTPRFLVIGGRPATLQRLERRLDRQYPGWRDWLTLAGATDKPEEAMSAGDAFLFPSHFEAFCLAEIEAAALGMPLLLTRHGGTEMILEDGVNGLFLDGDPRSMTEMLKMYLQGGSKLGQIVGGEICRPALFVPSTGRALDPEGYAARLEVLLEKSRRKGLIPL